LGLKDELRHSVEMHLPQTVSQAAALAEIQEHISEKKTYQRKFSTVKSENNPAFNTTELWKAR
jgi:anti-sigma-K factor RskA